VTVTFFDERGEMVTVTFWRCGAKMVTVTGSQKHGRMGIEAMKEGRMRKEPWDSNDDAAKKLSVVDFGPGDQVKVMALMERTVQSYAQAREILSGIVGHAFVSRSGLCATLSKNSIDKILSDTSNTSNLKPHLMAAGNIDKLYTNAIEPWTFELNPNKKNENIVSVHRLYAPMEYNGQIVVVKITVKEMRNPKDGNRIYSIKALEVFLE